MKAIVYHKYGSIDQLQLSEVPRPIPATGEVLIKVKAASINSWDWDLLRGRPYIVRLGGWFSPRFPIIGADVAGVVEEVGEGVQALQPGDEVVGDLSADRWGAFAEYVCAPAKSLVKKPAAISFEAAAALPQAGVMALQGIQDDGQVKAGDRVLINGAGGGVGSFAIQLAKMRGAEVTGVDRNDKFDFMKSLGADHVLDYRTTNFADGKKKYDLVLDVQVQRSFGECRRALTPTGKYVIVGGSIPKIFGHAFKQLFLPKQKRVVILTHQANLHLEHLLSLVEKGGLKVLIDRTLPLADTAKGFAAVGAGDMKGKIVVKP